MADQVQVITAKFNVDDGPLQKLLKTLELGGKDAEELTAALEKAGVSMDELGKAAEKATKTGTDGFKSLKQQLKEARNDATLLAQKFGENSKQALDAAKRVAQLTEELDDFNQRVKALNPEAKFNAVQQSLQGVLGGLQGVTGALQLFGAESEEVQKIATKLQGALNLAQGINSVIGLKDAFGNLRVVLGLTSAAQTAAATATTATTAALEAETVATAGAATATRGFTAALLSNPITAVAVALAALVSGILIYNAATSDSTELTEEQTKALEEQAKAQEELAKKYQDTGEQLKRQIEDQQLRTQVALGQITQFQAKLLQNDLNRIRALKESDAQFGKDITRRAEINKLFGLIEQQIKAEEAAKTKVDLINDKFYGKELKAIQTKKDLTKEIAVINQKVADDLAKIVPQYAKVVGSVVDLNKDLFAKTDAQLKRTQDIALGSFQIVSAGLFDLFQNQSAAAYDADARNLDDALKKKQISEEVYAQKIKELKQKQARQNKEIAIFQATVDFGVALINALTFKPANAVPASLILASVTAGANLARIIATPIPKFKEGTLNFQGGNMDSDGGRLAMLHPGEAVIPQDRNRMYAPAIRAIFNKQISPREINAFVQSKLNGKIESRVTADVDTYGLARAMSRNKGVQIENARVVGKAIASEIANRINRRQMI